MRVLISVTHLLGTGHLSRALTLARAFSTAGHEAHVMSGGVPVPNLSHEGVVLHQLPPVKSDGVNFTTLLNEVGEQVDENYLVDRRKVAVEILVENQFDVLITELFPFGRRVLKGEFLALLNGTRDLEKKPIVLSSIRDILAPPSKPRKVLEADAIVAAYYDGVLVHSDKAVTPLSTSWPVSAPLEDKLMYTGYVAPPAPGNHPGDAGYGEVLVTAGGGDVGRKLFESTIKAAALDTDVNWRLLVGGADKERNISELKDLVTSGNVKIEPTRPDFREMLSGANAAVCMCGYNTAMDLLQCGTRAVFVPFDEGGEVEQTLRANSLARQSGYEVVKASDATPERLIASLNLVRSKDVTPYDQEAFLGAQTSVRLVEGMVGGKLE